MNIASRMGLLNRLFGRRRLPVRPPWALAEDDFRARCTRCDLCRDACPESIIVRGRGGLPEIDFWAGECTFCRECVRVCTAGAFGATSAPPWTVTACITDDCLACDEPLDSGCAPVCDAGAIIFEPRADGSRRPVIDVARCRGCGACVGACPVGAIVLG